MANASHTILVVRTHDAELGVALAVSGVVLEVFVAVDALAVSRLAGLGGLKCGRGHAQPGCNEQQTKHGDELLQEK